MDIYAMLKNIDKKALDEAVKKAKEISKTKEGRDMIEKIRHGEMPGGISVSDAEQKKLFDELSKNPDVLKKLSDLIK